MKTKKSAQSLPAVGAEKNIDNCYLNTTLVPGCQDSSSWFARFFKKGEVCELRALGLTGKGPWEGWAKGTVSGYFDDPDKFAAAAKSLDSLKRANGIYFTLNPVDPALLARANNRLIVPKATTSDKQIVCHRWLLIDTDPERPSGISATDSELKKAITCRNEIADFLSANDFHEPMKAHSGNGGHLLYKLPDLPNTLEIAELKKQALKALSHKFRDDGVQVDETVSNASRITKLYGTLARKGDSTADRPHRRSYLEAIHDPITPVTLEQLEWLASLAPTAGPDSYAQKIQTAGNGKGKEKYARKVLESCCEKIRQSQPGNQHRIRLEAARLIGGYLQYINENEVLPALEKAVVDSGAREISKAMKDIRDGLENGKQAPITIKDNGAAKSHGNTEKPSDKKEKKTQSQILCELAEDIETFVTPDSEVFASIPVNKHIEVWPVRWQIFKRWLGKGFWDNFNKPPGGQAITDALNAIEAKAQFSGAPKREIFLRVAEHDGKFYLDLCNETWQVVEISADGWQVINVSPVPFRRPQGLLPLPEPRKGNKASFETLKKYINLKTENDFILLVAWLVGALRKEGNHVILVLQGPEGTGKTTAARLVKTIIDPNISSERSAPRNEQDFIIGASNNHITSFDNISGIQPWLSDALCRLSTGGGLATRRLYTNDEEKLFYARRPAILTGINPMPNRNDLASRCIVLSLEPIQGQVLEEKSLFEKFSKEVLPGMLGALCDAVSAALRNEQMELIGLPRMASFAAWILRAEEALPWKPGAFKKAYNKNTKNIVEQAVDADPVSSAIQKFMADKESWRGTASELLEELCKIVLKKTQKQKTWPKVSNMLSSELKRASSFLRQVGIEVKTGIKTTRGKRLITLDKGTKKTATIPTNATNEDHSLKIQEKISADDSGDENKKDRHSHQLLENIEENKESCDQSGDDSGDQIKRPPPNNYLKTLNKMSRNGKSGDSGDQIPTFSKDMKVFEI